MKKRSTRLQLHRETVQSLAGGLDQANGGSFETRQNSCPYTIPARLCVTLAVWCSVDFCP